MGCTTELRRGSHPGVVLLHGFTQSAASFEPLVRCAPKDGRAITALALPGHHVSVPVATGFEANCDRLAARIRAAVGTGAHVIAYSLGARCALTIATRAPTLFAAATLVGVHPGLASDAEREARREADRRWIDLLRDRGIEAFVSAWEALPLWGSQRKLPAAVLARQREIRLGHDPLALADSLEHMGLAQMPNLRPGLANLAVPVSFVTGELDVKFTRIAAVLPLEARVVPSAGHNVVLEAPEHVWAALGKFGE